MQFRHFGSVILNSDKQSSKHKYERSLHYFYSIRLKVRVPTPKSLEENLIKNQYSEIKMDIDITSMFFNTFFKVASKNLINFNIVVYIHFFFKWYKVDNILNIHLILQGCLKQQYL